MIYKKTTNKFETTRVKDSIKNCLHCQGLFNSSSIIFVITNQTSIHPNPTRGAHTWDVKDSNIYLFMEQMTRGRLWWQYPLQQLAILYFFKLYSHGQPQNIYMCRMLDRLIVSKLNDILQF